MLCEIYKRVEIGLSRENFQSRAKKREKNHFFILDWKFTLDGLILMSNSYSAKIYNLKYIKIARSLSQHKVLFLWINTIILWINTIIVLKYLLYKVFEIVHFCIINYVVFYDIKSLHEYIVLLWKIKFIIIRPSS